MRDAIGRFFFGVSGGEIDSLRSQNQSLLARLEILSDELADARRKLNDMHAEILGFSKHAIDGMLVNNGSLPWFGVGPQLAEPPAVDWTKITGGRASRLVERRNREFVKNNQIRGNSGWEEEQPTEDVEQAS